MRFNKSRCSECLDHCRYGAIRIDGGIEIKGSACTGCMLCISVCPSGCFDVKGMDFQSIIALLRKTGRAIPVPVLGCTARTDLNAHKRTSCLGFLSEEHFIALSVFLEKGLRINLAGCSDCGNGFIFDVLRKRIERAAEKTSLRVSDNIILVEDGASLKYQDISYDRRGFFSALKNMAFLKVADALGGDDPNGNTQAYSLKKLPVRRELLNRALGATSGGDRMGLLKAYYYTLFLEDNCNNCFACVGICPTGALKVDRKDSGPALAYNTSLCSGCGLCELFCRSRSVSLKSGFSGERPFEFDDPAKDVLCETGGAEK